MSLVRTKSAGASGEAPVGALGTTSAVQSIDTLANGVVRAKDIALVLTTTSHRPLVIWTTLAVTSTMVLEVPTVGRTRAGPEIMERLE